MHWHKFSGGRRVRFEAAYAQYYPRVRKYLQGRCAYQIEAEDAAQETFLQAFKIWDRVTSVTNVCNWLIGIARHVLSHMHRALYSRPEGRAVEYDQESDARVSAPEQGWNLYIEQLRRQFQGFGPAQCAVMTGLSHGESPRDIADRRGTSLSATNMAIATARNRLRQKFTAGF